MHRLGAKTVDPARRCPSASDRATEQDGTGRVQSATVGSVASTRSLSRASISTGALGSSASHTTSSRRCASSAQRSAARKRGSSADSGLSPTVSAATASGCSRLAATPDHDSRRPQHAPTIAAFSPGFACTRARQNLAFSPSASSARSHPGLAWHRVSRRSRAADGWIRPPADSCPNGCFLNGLARPLPPEVQIAARFAPYGCALEGKCRQGKIISARGPLDTAVSKDHRHG